MSTHLINHVQDYIAPCDDELETQFAYKMDALIAICAETIFQTYYAFMDYQHSNYQLLHPEEFSTVHATLESALRTFFPTPFLEECKDYKAQFTSLENAIVLFALNLPHHINTHFVNNMKYLSRTTSRAIEYLLIRLTELFFLSHCDLTTFWNEVYKDSQLSEIMQRFKVYELVSFKNINRSTFLGDFELSKHAESLMDSYCTELVRRGRRSGL